MRMFKNINKENQPTPDGKTFPSFAMKKFLFRALFFTLFVFVIGQGIVVAMNLRESWSEVVFAYQKPELVKTLRLDYLEKQKSLDKSFSVKEKTSEQKLIDEVVRQLQNQSKP